MKKIINNFFIALMTLTRIRIPFQEKIIINETNLVNSTFFYPVIGAFYGAISYFLALLLFYIKLDLYFISFFVLILPFIINKFFHFDGLCDLLDGFLSDKDRETRLKIMKEPTIGSFALSGGILFILFKFLLFLNFFENKISLIYLIIIPVYSRFAIIFLAYNSKYPRTDGIGKFIVGKISIFNLISSIFLTLFISNLTIFFYFQNLNKILSLLILLVIIILFLILLKYYSKNKINGITGDVLGAAVELSEVVLLIIIIIIEKYVFY